MKIDALLLCQKPKDFLKHEAKTLKFLMDDPEIAKNYSRLHSDAANWYKLNYKQIENKKLSSLYFETEIDLMLDGRRGVCHIGTAMEAPEGHFTLLSYYLALCKAGKKPVIRKYHFDYARHDLDKKCRQPHPVFHLQYPGELSPRLKGLGLVDCYLHPWLSEPRLCFTPMSLAFVMNVVFKDFPSESSLKIIERSEWRDLMRNNEDSILKPYYHNCNQFLMSPAGRLITNDFFYGK